MLLIPKETSLTGTGDPSVAPPGFDVFTVGASGLEGSIALPRERASTIVTSALLDSGQTAVVGGLTTELDQETISIAGGIVLFLIALRMIFPSHGGFTADTPEGEPFIVPLAIPLIAGPSTLAMLMLMQRSEPGATWELWLALTIAWGLTAVILLAAPFFYRVLHQRGLIAMERLMGMVLVMISVQMLLNGIKDALTR